MFDHKLEPKPSDARRVEVFTGPGRRRRWSSDEKARILEETLAVGAVVSEVARRHGITSQQLFGWRRSARGRAIERSDAPGLAGRKRRHLRGSLLGTRLRFRTAPVRRCRHREQTYACQLQRSSWSPIWTRRRQAMPPAFEEGDYAMKKKCTCEEPSEFDDHHEIDCDLIPDLRGWFCIRTTARSRAVASGSIPKT